ncbi:guanine nucleotide-binding protein subunit gamma 3-like [Malania oleifera]|uniref:guanine nucleotide-binding protein subunit gamma 3-like n=1 Tax=Malania oleifera TaxID=397392 RepID=UPI0025AE48C2|nr:guanine nucleotide-binding protein subunit gamma 3-like [Malania oleifera]
MYASGCCSCTVPSLPPPLPKSPPEYPDLYGKRRELAKIQMLERQIGFLEEELKSIEGLPPASRCCKEVADFVVANSDPLMPKNQKRRKACRFWKWLCGMSCFKFSWICCCAGCSLHPERPICCDCQLCSCNPLNLCDCNCHHICNCNCHHNICDCNCHNICHYNSCNCPSCIKCSLPKCRCRWRCFSLPSSSCCFKISWRNWCIFQCPSCPNCFCRRWSCSCPKCPKVTQCSGCCTKSCCNPCCLCY